MTPLLSEPDLESISKTGFWFKVKADARNKPEQYIRYFEDLFRTPNAEIGPKDFFEMGFICPIHETSDNPDHPAAVR